MYRVVKMERYKCKYKATVEWETSTGWWLWRKTNTHTGQLYGEIVWNWLPNFERASLGLESKLENATRRLDFDAM